MSERLQKLLARAGHGSRRAAEALIVAGRVTVNGETITELGAKADPASDAIALDGKLLELGLAHMYFAMNKPSGYVTTSQDPQQRPTVMHLLPEDLPPHVLPIGRLDQATEGLLLFTNDGDFAHRLSHPRYEVEKEYAALVAGTPNAASLAKLRAGVDIAGYRTSPAHAVLAPPPQGRFERVDHAWLRIVIHEGRKRQVRLMCAAVGHQVRTLVRTRLGPVELGDLASGATRPLQPDELEVLRRQLSLQSG